MTISLETLTTDPTGSENGLVVRNIPSGVQTIEIDDGYGNILGTSQNPLIISAGSSNRTIKTFIALAQVIPYMTEGMITLTEATNYVAGSSATSFGVSSGKVLRIQSVYINGSGQANIRISNSGAVNTSTLVISPYLPATGTNMSFNDGIELSGNMQFGISMVQFNSPAPFTTDIYIIGYEY